MFKKSLILALALNTFSIQPAQPSASASNDLATACLATGILTVAGVICSCKAYKDFKKGWPAIQEVEHQIQALQEMGAKVYQVSRLDFEFGDLVIKENYTLDIPSDFSHEQKKKAKEHWRLLATNQKDANNMLGWPSVAIVFLIPAAIMGLVECIELSGLGFNKN